MSVMMPSPAEIEDMYLHIKDNRGPEVVAATAITFALATIAVILRLIARRISKAILLADDWTILAAWVRMENSRKRHVKPVLTQSRSLASPKSS